MADDHVVMDTRTPSPVHRAVSAETKEGDYKPDLSAEVALLSTKLVNAINYNTNLDDTLQASRHELEQQRAKCAALEAENRRHDELVSSGTLVKKAEMDDIIANLRTELANERAAREAAEKAKKQTEGELENLTSALFEEANSMVAKARRDKEAVEKKNSQLKGQLQDTETLMMSQQEQLLDLKTTMEKLQETQAGRSPSMPSTPTTANNAVFDALQLSPNTASLADLPPEHPLHFSQLISPVLRSDTTAYSDFQDLLLLAKRLGAHSRSPSNNSTQQVNLSTYAAVAATSSSPNLPGAFSFSNNSSPTSNSGTSGLGSVPPLKESKFYKRALTEDIEPTLRLDLAPGLSFLSRRTVLGALLAGTLAVEPYPQNKHYFACTLCGEGRRTEHHARKYRFRTSEDDGVSKPLCDYCVARLRATCDFVGFLRMVRDGYWKSETEEDQKSAWEESVRLRERMFWSRLGGGVVPCIATSASRVEETPSSTTGAKNGRTSLESIPEDSKTPEAEIGADGKQSTDSEVFQDESEGGIAEAIVNISSRAAAISTPEMQPSQAAPAEPVTPPHREQLSSTPDRQSSTSEPPTPYQDAAQELDTKEDTAAGTEEHSEQNGTAVPSQESSHAEQESAASDVQREDPDSTASSTLQPPATGSKETTPRNSLHVEPRPQEQRKSSSLQDRIRALQAAAGQ